MRAAAYRTGRECVLLDMTRVPQARSKQKPFATSCEAPGPDHSLLRFPSMKKSDPVGNLSTRSTRPTISYRSSLAGGPLLGERSEIDGARRFAPTVVGSGL